MRNRHTIVCILLLVSIQGVAQFSLPRIDVEAKVTQNIVPAGDNSSPSYSLKALETTNIFLGAHWQINQHIAVGWIYSNSLRGSGYNNTDFKFNFGQGDTKALTSFSGIDLRLSAGRARKWRPYLSISYCTAQIIEDKGAFRLATKTNAIGGSIGFMRRMGNRLYFNAIELGVRKFSDKLFWADTGFLIEAKMGFTYNIGKKK